jgi:hypothetical protein
MGHHHPCLKLLIEQALKRVPLAGWHQFGVVGKKESLLLVSLQRQKRVRQAPPVQRFDDRHVNDLSNAT